MAAPEYIKNARQILQSQLYAVISTVDGKGDPWTTPVFFAFSDEGEIFWISEESSLHSENILGQPVIFNSLAPEGTGNALYLKGKAEVCTKEREIEGLKSLKARANLSIRYDSKDVASPSPWRLYRFIPRICWTLGPGVVVDGYEVDRRIELSLVKVFGKEVL